jgi:hypothetical protein
VYSVGLSKGNSLRRSRFPSGTPRRGVPRAYEHK